MYLNEGKAPAGQADEVSTHLGTMEKEMGHQLGDPNDPLLVSVRSGAMFSMPGMMETVLNIGLNDKSVEGLAALSGNPRFAWDSYRRLLQMFGKTVLDIEGHEFESRIEGVKAARGVKQDIELDASDLQQLVGEFKSRHRGRDRQALPAGAARAAGCRGRGSVPLLDG